MGGTLQVLNVEDIAGINRRMIEEFGGLFLEADRNLANPGSLEHVLEEIQGSLFGHKAYPTVVEKAAAVCWRVITAHVFHDGNKRTGMEACATFLELNRHAMRIDYDVVETALRIAKNEIAFKGFVQWPRERTTRISESSADEVTR